MVTRNVERRHVIAGLVQTSGREAALNTGLRGFVPLHGGPGGAGRRSLAGRRPAGHARRAGRPDQRGVPRAPGRLPGLRAQGAAGDGSPARRASSSPADSALHAADNVALQTALISRTARGVAELVVSVPRPVPQRDDAAQRLQGAVRRRRRSRAAPGFYANYQGPCYAPDVAAVALSTTYVSGTNTTRTRQSRQRALGRRRARLRAPRSRARARSSPFDRMLYPDNNVPDAQGARRDVGVRQLQPARGRDERGDRRGRRQSRAGHLGLDTDPTPARGCWSLHMLSARWILVATAALDGRAHGRRGAPADRQVPLAAGQRRLAINREVVAYELGRPDPTPATTRSAGGSSAACARRGNKVQLSGSTFGEYWYDRPARAVKVRGSTIGFAAVLDAGYGSTLRDADLLRRHAPPATRSVAVERVRADRQPRLRARAGARGPRPHRAPLARHGSECPDLDEVANADPRPNCVRPGASVNAVFAVARGSRTPVRLARSRTIDPRSVRLRDGRVSWVQGGRRRSAALPAG